MSCSRRPEGKGLTVPTVRRPTQRYGEETKMENPSAMPADFTTNFIMYIVVIPVCRKVETILAAVK